MSNTDKSRENILGKNVIKIIKTVIIKNVDMKFSVYDAFLE
jgi:hypothetical protein